MAGVAPGASFDDFGSWARGALHYRPGAIPLSDLFDQERATVREWTEVLARVRFGTVKVAGRNIAGSRIKLVAARLADYADSDGSRVRPGLPRIAVDCEVDYSSAKRCVQHLVRLGLLRLVRPGARLGRVS